MLAPKKRPKSPFWILRGTVDGHRVEVSRKWTTAVDARRAIPQVLAELSGGGDADKVPQSVFTVDDAIELYRELKPHARFLDGLSRYFAGMAVADINNAEMRRAANALPVRIWLLSAASSACKAAILRPQKAAVSESSSMPSSRLRRPPRACAVNAAASSRSPCPAIGSITERAPESSARCARSDPSGSPVKNCPSRLRCAGGRLSSKDRAEDLIAPTALVAGTA